MEATAVANPVEALSEEIAQTWESVEDKDERVAKLTDIRTQLVEIVGEDRANEIMREQASAWARKRA